MPVMKAYLQVVLSNYNGGELVSGNRKDTLVYPLPYSTDFSGGEYEFSNEVECIVSTYFKNDDFLELLQELWTNFTLSAGKLNIIKSTSIKENEFAITRLAANISFPILEKDFEYVIDVNAEGIFVSSNGEKGMIHAFTTLLQMIEPKNLEIGKEKFIIKNCCICDKPAISFRGIHICVFPETTLIFIQKVIRLSGLMKFTHIVIEFWGMLKYDVMSELSWGNAYSKDQIRPLIKEVNALGMEVIPMFNHLGHASSSRVVYGKHVVLDQNPRKVLLFEPDGWTWCLSNPDTINLLKEVRKELIELCGEGQYFHLGCDEAYSFATCDLCKNTNKLDLLTNYINSLADDLKNYNRRGIIWGDALLDTTKWQSPNYATSRPDQGTHKILDKLDRSLIIDDWQYYITEDKVATAEYFMEKGFDVILSPWRDLNNIRALSNGAQSINALGFLATTWNTLNESIDLIPIAGECAWVGDRKKGKIEVDLMRCVAASLQRKLVPVHGIYKDAGWHEDDTKI